MSYLKTGLFVLLSPILLVVFLWNVAFTDLGDDE